MLSRGSLTIGRFDGIPIRLHLTLGLVLPYVAWGIHREVPSLAQLAGVPVDQLALPSWVLGALLAAGLFTCVLLHEFGHVVVGKLGGARFTAVTLMLVGGVSELREPPRKPLAEAAMAVAGPIVSVLLSGAGFLAWYLAPQADVRFACFYLATVNLALAVFNMLPAFPMDGGRVLRALLSTLTSRLRATKVAVVVGQAVAALLFVAGLFLGNWVLSLIALLIIIAARAELVATLATSPESSDRYIHPGSSADSPGDTPPPGGTPPPPRSP